MNQFVFPTVLYSQFNYQTLLSFYEILFHVVSSHSLFVFRFLRFKSTQIHSPQKRKLSFNDTILNFLLYLNSLYKNLKSINYKHFTNVILDPTKRRVTLNIANSPFNFADLNLLKNKFLTILKLLRLDLFKLFVFYVA